GNSGARQRLAEFLLATTDSTAALGHFEYLRRQDPGNPALLLGLARCRRRQGQTDEAKRLLDDLLAHHPREVAALNERAGIARTESQPGVAERLYRRALEQDPRDQD